MFKFIQFPPNSNEELNPLELEAYAVVTYQVCWELNSAPLEEQYMLLKYRAIFLTPEFWLLQKIVEEKITDLSNMIIK